MITLKSSMLISATAFLITFSVSSMAADGTMTFTNKTGGILNVVVTHFGCAGVHDGVATACTELPDGHKGYIDGIKNDQSDKIVFSNMGMSTGYVVWGINTNSNERDACGAGLNSSLTFFTNNKGMLECKLN